jgi:1,2-dihydroxy-3-keto-5-methylthiopentene dioxygenase
MAILHIPDQNQVIHDPEAIRTYFTARGILFDQWPTPAALPDDADQDTILGAYSEVLKPYMESNGYQTADVINVHPGMENIDAIGKKFLSEHIHDEDEVRYFVDGEGIFWFNLDNGKDPIFCLVCEKGDLISVPAGTKHWFDFGPKKHVKCIRVFIDQSGWVPHYTGSAIDAPYNQMEIVSSTN